MSDVIAGQVILQSTGIAVAAFLWLATWLRQRPFGPALLTIPASKRWSAWIMVFLAFLSAIYYTRGVPLQTVVLGVCFYLALASVLPLTARFSIHNEGIISGIAIIPWAKLDGWAWESPAQQLSLWAPWFIVHLLPFRSSVRCKTGQVKSIDLEAHLQRFAPERFRPSPTRLS
ncbi:MAG: hypothetical protein B7X34_07845 [Acidobacteriia bacterium 12-62-4]|nr:MAG: hypothetical protein B7X34_07845 [Acidobacteriia bacterium 12-62-4]